MIRKTLTICVESTEDFLKDTLNSARRIDAGEEIDDGYLLSLPDEAALARVLSETNLELLRTIGREEPDSVRELARLVDRDVKNVSTAVNELADLGLVEFETNGRAKSPRIWYDDLEVQYEVRIPAEANA